MKDIDIRNYVINNFKNDSIEDIRLSIDESIKIKDDDSLIGLGVLFELAWSNSNEDTKYSILNNIYKKMNN